LPLDFKLRIEFHAIKISSPPRTGRGIKGVEISPLVGWTAILYLACRIVDKARDYFRTPIPEAFADKLARRAEAVFAHHRSWQRRFKSARGRDAILTSMRHWLASVLAKERPALFRALPGGFKVGHPLPMEHIVSVGRGYRRAGSRGRSPHHPPSHFVHGCEFLAV
jgi:hypothetical protein